MAHSRKAIIPKTRMSFFQRKQISLYTTFFLYCPVPKIPLLWSWLPMTSLNFQQWICFCREVCSFSHSLCCRPESSIFKKQIPKLQRAIKIINHPQFFRLLKPSKHLSVFVGKMGILFRHRKMKIEV